MNKFLIIFLLLSLSFAYSQEKGGSGKNEDDAVKYTLKSSFPVNVQHVYELIDTSKFVRQFSDSTKKTYTRILKYYFSVWAPSSPNKEKIQEVSVSVDSLEYKLITADGEIFYNSQADDLRPPKIDDYLNSMIPLGLEFDLVYSPYQEAGDIAGSVYKSKVAMLQDPKTTPSDSIYAFIWNDRMSKSALTNSFDIVKAFYPLNKIAVDSSWIKNISYEIEGASIIDSVKFTLKSFNIKTFIIEGTTLKAKSIENDKAILPSIRNILNIKDIDGVSTYYLRLQPKGTLEELRINSNFNVFYQLKDEVIAQKINSSRTWKLLGMYKI